MHRRRGPRRPDARWGFDPHPGHFRALIEEIPEIVEAYRLTGTVDYIVKVVVTDMESYDAVHKQMIQQLEFSQVNSMIAMEELKFTTAVPTAYL